MSLDAKFTAYVDDTWVLLNSPTPNGGGVLLYRRADVIGIEVKPHPTNTEWWRVALFMKGSTTQFNLDGDHASTVVLISQLRIPVELNKT